MGTHTAVGFIGHRRHRGDRLVPVRRSRGSGQGEPIGTVEHEGGAYVAPSNVRIQGGWTQQRVAVDGFELTVFRQPAAGPRPAIGLTATVEGAAVRAGWTRSRESATVDAVADPPDTEPTAQWSDALSAAWERHRERLFESQRAVSEWLVEQLAPEPGQTVLELAAGPGETGFLAADRLGPSGRLISTDLGAGMVEAAARGAAERGLDNVECRTMDAQAPDLPDDSVDGVLCRYGLMLMPAPDRALAGARRVLRPGGRIAAAVWGPPDRNPWMMLLAMAILENGHQPPGDPFGPGGPFSLADAEVLEGLARDAGFQDARVQEHEAVVRFGDLDDYLGLQGEVSGPLALLLSSLSEEDRTAIRASLEPMLEPFATSGGYELPSHTLALVATA